MINLFLFSDPIEFLTKLGLSYIRAGLAIHLGKNGKAFDRLFLYLRDIVKAIIEKV